MTKEITKARILQEIQDKLKLREFEPEVFSFGERVVPVYEIKQHLLTWETIYKQVSITSATIFMFFTVPDDEKWTLTNYNVIFMAAGAYKVSGLYVSRKTGINADNCYLDLKEGQTVSYVVNLPQPVMLNAGDQLTILIDDYTSTAALRVYINVTKEKIR